MSTKTYTVEHIIAKLREAEVALSRGQTVQEICRVLWFSWNGHLETPEA